MTRYLDSSVLVPLLIDEPTTESCKALIAPPGTIMSSSLSLVETSAAIARAERMRRITAERHAAARHKLELLWRNVTPVPAADPVVRFACDLARRYGLRGYDAVQCASALTVADEPEFVAVSSDQALLSAWSELGLYTVDVSES